MKRKPFTTTEQRNKAINKYRSTKKEIKALISEDENQEFEVKIKVLGLSRAEGLRLAIKKL
jgi:hypothetical protein